MSRSVSKSLRAEIIKRDLGLCRYCGTMPMLIDIEIDHVIPYSIGGPTHINNLVTACFDCNRDKSDSTTWNPLPIGATHRPKELPLLGSMEPTKEKVDRSYKPVGKSDPSAILRVGQYTQPDATRKTTYSMSKKQLTEERERKRKCIYCQTDREGLLNGYSFVYHDDCQKRQLSGQHAKLCLSCKENYSTSSVCPDCRNKLVSIVRK